MWLRICIKTNRKIFGVWRTFLPRLSKLQSVTTVDFFSAFFLLMQNWSSILSFGPDQKTSNLWRCFRHSCEKWVLRVLVDFLRQLNAFGKEWFHIQYQNWRQKRCQNFLPRFQRFFCEIFIVLKKRFFTYFRILGEGIWKFDKQFCNVVKTALYFSKRFLKENKLFWKIKIL